jgi:hypothetical protein
MIFYFVETRGDLSARAWLIQESTCCGSLAEAKEKRERFLDRYPFYDRKDTRIASFTMTRAKVHR